MSSVCQCGIWSVSGGTCSWGRWRCSSISVIGARINQPGTLFSPGWVKYNLQPKLTNAEPIECAVSCKNDLFDWTITFCQVQMNPEAVLSRGTILLTLKFIPPGSEGHWTHTHIETDVYNNNKSYIMHLHICMCDSFANLLIQKEGSLSLVSYIFGWKRLLDSFPQNVALQISL